MRDLYVEAMDHSTCPRHSIAVAPGNFFSRKRLLSLLILATAAGSSLFMSGCATSGTGSAYARNEPSPLPGPDYYQSSDNPFHAD